MSDKEFKVGDRVQKFELGTGVSLIRVGTVVEVIMGNRDKFDYYSNRRRAEPYVSEVKVSWDNSDSEAETVAAGFISKEDSDLEKQFRAKAKEISGLIDAKLDEALLALNEAERLSDEHGIPFYGEVSLLGQPYVPSSFKSKWENVDPEVVGSETGVYSDGSGWQHSQVCY